MIKICNWAADGETDHRQLIFVFDLFCAYTSHPYMKINIDHPKNKTKKSI
jgi:hypothetical protein